MENTGNRRFQFFNIQRKVAPYIFVAPGVLFYLMVTIFPVFSGIWISFHRWNIIFPRKPWVGLENYISVFQDPRFFTSLCNTLLYTAGVVPGAMIGGLVVAFLLNQRIKGRTLYRLLYYLPVVTPVAISAVIWKWIYDPRYGIFNWLISLFGFPPQDWLMNTGLVMFSVIVVAIWCGIGYRMVVFLAALQGIPKSYYEAAEIDGANKWQTFRYITLPLLKPATLFILVTSIISSFQVFALVSVLADGTGPLDSALVLVYYIFECAFTRLRMGYAAAMSMILFIIILIITALQWKFLGREVTYE